MIEEKAFWEQKTLEEMSPSEWERLCDRCGRCCAYKFEDDLNGKFYYTDVACEWLDVETCQCAKYEERLSLGARCVKLDPARIAELKWLPETCAYRLLSEGKPLPEWHPLITGDQESVHEAGISARHHLLPKSMVGDPETHIITHD